MKEKIKNAVLKNSGYTLSDFEAMKSRVYEIKNIDKAIEIIQKAVAGKIPITIVGDYDCDGICATAIFKLALRKLGVIPKTRLPKRFSEGYGLSEKIVDEIADGLLITVDNGIAAASAIKKAKEKGLAVIITDHHLAPVDGIPEDADLVIDPNAIPNSATFNGYCGAGLAYKICKELVPSEEKKYLTLATIATIADSVPLIEENRVIVQRGLNEMLNPSSTTVGLQALLQATGLQYHITEKDIGFKLGPCLNAPGRLMDDGAEKSLDLLSFIGNYEFAEKKANKLLEYNEERKSLTETAFDTFRTIVENNCLFVDNVLVLQSNDVGEGLVGLCAGKLAEEYKRPCLVFGPLENGIYKGSGRSYGGVHLKEILDKAKSLLPDDAIAKYGGHAAAVGISVREEFFDDFVSCINSLDIKIEEIEETADIEIYENEIKSAIEESKPYAPFGEGNPQIKFKIKNYKTMPVGNKMFGVLKEKHLKFCGACSEALWFGAVQKYQSMGTPSVFDITGTIGENHFNGKVTPSIEIISIEPIKTKFTTSPFARKLEREANKKMKGV